MANRAFMELTETLGELLGRNDRKAKLKDYDRKLPRRDALGRFLPEPAHECPKNDTALERARAGLKDALKFLEQDCRFEALSYDKAAAAYRATRTKNIRYRTWRNAGLLLAAIVMHVLMWTGPFAVLSTLPAVLLIALLAWGAVQRLAESLSATQAEEASKQYRTFSDDVTKARLFDAESASDAKELTAVLEKLMKAKAAIDVKAPALPPKYREEARSEIEVEKILNDDSLEARVRVLDASPASKPEEEVDDSEQNGDLRRQARR
jgi:hypothetical protein